MKEALLVEPKTNKRGTGFMFPPFGLMRISSMLKGRGYAVKFVKGNVLLGEQFNPDKIFITSLFTWEGLSVLEAIKFYRTVYPDAEVIVGGVFASLNPDKCYKSGASKVIKGIYSEAENYPLDYSFVNTAYSYILTQRGCTRNCPYCVVSEVEGNKIFNVKKSILDQVVPNKSYFMVIDNNFLLNPYHMDIMDEFIELDKPVDFRNGLDVMLLTKEFMKKISQLKVKDFHTAYDKNYQDRYIIRMNRWIDRYRLKISPTIFMLYNFNESPADIYERLKVALVNTKNSVFPMFYNPNTLTKNNHIGGCWDEKTLRGFRRMVGQEHTSGMLYSRGIEHFKKAFGSSPEEFVEILKDKSVLLKEK